MRPRSSAVLVAVSAVISVACSGGGSARSAATTTPPPPPVSPTVLPSITVSVTPPAVPEQAPPTSGSATASCVKGWLTPPKGSKRFGFPLRVIRRTTGVKGPLVVVDMRFFQGPESPPSEMGYLQDISRWYVKLYARNDPAFQGRFLVESRRFGSGVSAVAPYDTTGFDAPDWVGFQYDSGDPRAHTYPGLPGVWAGTPYDFVKGGGGLEIPGLPAEVVSCLSGT